MTIISSQFLLKTERIVVFRPFMPLFQPYAIFPIAPIAKHIKLIFSVHFLAVSPQLGALQETIYELTSNKPINFFIFNDHLWCTTYFEFLGVVRGQKNDL